MKHSFVINSQGLDIWRHTANGIEHVSKINADDKGARIKLQGWLANVRRSSVLIADLADERHVIERLPHTSRTDRLQLAKRKLAQHFQDAAFTSATLLPVGPEDSLAKPMLLSALPRSPSITLWLDILSEASMQGQIDAPLLTSVPFLLEHWYRRQRALPPQSLLLTLGTGGMRQIFFRQRRLAFSRVITARAASLAENLPVYREELMQTLAWLPSQRLVEGPPPVLVLATETDLQLLRELAPATNSAMDFIDIARCPGGGTDVLSLVLREAHSRGTPGHYECHSLRRARQFSAARRATWIITVATLVAGLTKTTAALIDASHLRQEAGLLVTEQQKHQTELEKLNAEALDEPGADTPDDWLDKAEDLAQDQGIAPVVILQTVAGLLDKAPWARLESLVWKKQTAWENGESGSPAKDEPQIPQTANAKHASIGTRPISIELEISLTRNEPPQAAADKLVSFWQQQYGSPIKAHIDSGTAHLRLDATLPLPEQERREKAP
ncbi:MAG: hypothetical protein LBP99_08870 [Azoarcus sp.]|jgi:hypothetical protein|nr:hypothetical protein [Azoarcus sp.]